MKPLHEKSTPIKKKLSVVKQQKNTLEHYFSSPKKNSCTLKVINHEEHKILLVNDIIQKSVEDPSCNGRITIRKDSEVYPIFVKNKLCVNKPNLTFIQSHDVSKGKQTASSMNIENTFSYKDPIITIDLQDEPGSQMLMEVESEIGRQQENNSNLLGQEPLQITNHNQINNKQVNSSIINKITEEKPITMLNTLGLSKEGFHSGKKKISGKSFKEIIYNFHFDGFYKPYKKLYNTLTPSCCDLSSCKETHKSIIPKEITSFYNGPIFNILDNPVTSWVYDIPTIVFSVLRPDQYLRGDVIRILFDYILTGPSEDLMWDIKHVLSTHFEMHPPCTEQMRDFYLGLLGKAYEKDCYFKTKLAGSGILSYTVNQLKEYYKLPNCSAYTTANYNSSSGSNREVTDENCSQIINDGKNKITFETLEERWDNYEPLFENENNEIMNAIDELVQNTSQETKEASLNKHKLLPRLTVVLELILDLLEANFLIYVSKLKIYIMDDTGHAKVQLPLIKNFMDINFNMTVFNLYTRTTDQNLCIQLSRLIGLMAEQVHVSKLPVKGKWQYPYLHEDCFAFTSDLSGIINKCEWNEDEKITRLQMLHPPWLQLYLAMGWANTELNLKMGTDLKTLVEIIHMHVKSPVKLEKDVKKVKHDTMILSHRSTNFAKKATKRNDYGETLLHRLCKHKQSSLSEFYSLLAVSETDINAKDYYGWTPLHEAVNANSLLKTKALLQYQPPPGRKAVDIGAQNCKGITALHEAVSSNNLELCQLLVDYGGVCLLRKTDSGGLTPLDLVEKGSEINYYFEKVMKAQELLNLSPDSFLNLTDYLMQLIMLACDSFISDHYTWQIYQVMKFNLNIDKLSPKKWLAVDQETLLGFKHDQNQFRKLRRILNKLAENPGNSTFVRLWDSKFHDLSITTHSRNKFKSISGSDNGFKKITVCRLLLRELFKLED